MGFEENKQQVLKNLKRVRKDIDYSIRKLEDAQDDRELLEALIEAHKNTVIRWEDLK